MNDEPQARMNRLRRQVSAPIAAAALATALTGCVHALHAYNQPGPERLHLVSKRSGTLLIRVEGHDETLVPADGRVEINVPRLPRGCSVYLVGIIKMRDGSPERVRAIHVVRDGKVVRKLSLDDIHDLPLEPGGYRKLKL
jgi:hypothetical protein